MLHLLLAVTLAILPQATGNMFGGCCGMSLPPPPCPPPMCAPMPPPCPPPVFCPPQFCPPALPCPPPPPPPPPPMCPPPMYQPSPCQSYAPAPVFQQYAMQPANDCCCRCGQPCRYRARHRTHGSKLFSAASAEAEMEEDPTCNSRKLKAVLEDNMASDPTISKRAIQKAAEEKLFGKFNVICAKGDFSYVAYTETYCQLSNDDVTCYAFRPM